MRAPHAVRASPSATVRLTALSVLLFVACAHREGCTGDYCGTLVIATAGEPESLLPPVITSAVGLAVADQLFLKLADIGLSTNTVGDEDFQPQLAERWEWADSVTLVFHLDPRARWQDARRWATAPTGSCRGKRGSSSSSRRTRRSSSDGRTCGG